MNFFYEKKEDADVNKLFTFDIETSSQYIDGRKTAHMVCWSAVGEGAVYFGRTTDDAVKWINTLKKGSFVYVHNLSYEFQFIKKTLNWQRVFATDERKVIECVTDRGVTFRCSYALTNKSLATLAKEMGASKSDGWDYDKTRTPTTPLSKDEIEYSVSDSIILYDWLSRHIERDNISHTPLTATAYVRRAVRDEYADNNAIVRILNAVAPREDEYALLNEAFAGGFTHANPRHVGHVMRDVDSFDLSSAYPAAMVSERYPMSKGRRVTSIPRAGTLWVGRVRMYGVTLRENVPDAYISFSHCSQISGYLLSNGRVVNADCLVTTITNVDLRIIRRAYQVDHFEFIGGYAYKARPLPRELICYVYDLFEKKSTLKGVVGQEDAYKRSKERINSLYGMCATNPCRDRFSWDAEEAVLTAHEGSLPTFFDKHKITSYAWAPFITAYVRQSIWDLILECGDDYLYSDTDSVKMTRGSKYVNSIAAYNQRAVEKCSAIAQTVGIEGEPWKRGDKIMGVFEHDATYVRFKTWGAKRYLVEKPNGGFDLTVAGVNKRNGTQWLVSSFKDPFKAFQPDLVFPPDACGRKTATYIDECDEYVINGTHVTSPSAIHLEGASYSMGIDGDFMNFLNELNGGYIEYVG